MKLINNKNYRSKTSKWIYPGVLERNYLLKRFYTTEKTPNSDDVIKVGQLNIGVKSYAAKPEGRPFSFETKYLPLKDITTKLMERRYKAVINLCNKVIEEYEPIAINNTVDYDLESLKKELADVYNFKSDAHANLNQHEEVIESLQKAIELYPCAEHYGDLASYCLLNKRYEDALKYSNLCIEYDDEDSDPYSIKANALFELGRYDEVGKLCRIALAKDPNDSSPYIIMAKLCYNLKDYANSMKNIERAIAKEGNEWHLLDIKSNILLKARRHEDAYNLINNFAKFEKDCIEARIKAGEILFKLKRYEQSIEHWDYIINFENSTDSQRHLSQKNKIKALILTNKKDEAEKALADAKDVLTKREYNHFTKKIQNM